MKLGLSVKIDVTKIDKNRLFKGAKGTYLDLTTFIDLDNLSQYGDNGFISQSVSKEERAAKVELPILGNVKVFYNDSTGATHPNTPQPANNPAQHASGNSNQPNPTYGGMASSTAAAPNDFEDNDVEDIPW